LCTCRAARKSVPASRFTPQARAIPTPGRLQSPGLRLRRVLLTRNRAKCTRSATRDAHADQSRVGKIGRQPTVRWPPSGVGDLPGPRTSKCGGRSYSASAATTHRGS
jgi:hypothetical protein